MVLAVEGKQEKPLTQMTAVLNWIEELKRRVPSGKE